MLSSGRSGVKERKVGGILKWTSPVSASRTIQVLSVGLPSRCFVRQGEKRQNSWNTSTSKVDEGIGIRYLKTTFRSLVGSMIKS